MCDVWNYPTKLSEEIKLETIEKLPDMFFCNVTGGEPFVRDDISEIVRILVKKSKRVVISTNGCFTDRVVDLSRKYPDVGIRISIEGLVKTNDDIRGIPGGFDKVLQTLLELAAMGRKDIGFGMTVQDSNCKDLVPLYFLARSLGMEFATATIHNSFYFHKHDNKITDKDLVCGEFMKLARLMLKSERPKEWFRAYFNYGLMNYIQNRKRLLPCEMGRDGFFLDPWGDVLPCNGMDEKFSMGNLKEKSWEAIWGSTEAKVAHDSVKTCSKNCWMIGSAAPAIWHHPIKPFLWVLRNKIRLSLGSDIEV